MGSATVPEIDVLIVNYNSADDLQTCLISLEGEPIRRIVIVDNNSANPDVAALRSFVADREKVLLVESPINLGFAGGVNLAFNSTNEVDDDVVWLLNPDTTVGKGASDTLLRALQQSPADVVSPIIRTGHGEFSAIWYAGGRINVGTGESFLDATEPSSATSLSVPTDFVSGASLMTDRKTWRRLGGLREDLFLYWEDTDFSLRAKEAGLNLGLVPSASIWHRVGGSGDRSGKSASYYYYMSRNRLWICGQYGSKFDILLRRGARATVRLLARASREEHAAVRKMFAVARGSVAGLRPSRSN